jgi:hypothetical protein
MVRNFTIPNLFRSIELWFLDRMILLLSGSVVIRMCIRSTAMLFSNKQVYLLFLLVFASGLFGVVSGYTVNLMVTGLR